MRRLRILLLVAVAAVAVAGCSREEARPSGITERWLQAVGDIGRDRIASDATERAAEFGDPALVDALRPADPPEDEAWFEDLEVGKAAVAGDTARVPYRLTVRDGGDEVEETGTAVLQRRDGEWKVSALDEQRPGELVPSAGGERPASATTKHWLAAVALGVILCVGSALVIESQPATGQRAGAVQ